MVSSWRALCATGVPDLCFWILEVFALHHHMRLLHKIVPRWAVKILVRADAALVHALFLSNQVIDWAPEGLAYLWRCNLNVSDLFPSGVRIHYHRLHMQFYRAFPWRIDYNIVKERSLLWTGVTLTLPSSRVVYLILRASIVLRMLLLVVIVTVN